MQACSGKSDAARGEWSEPPANFRIEAVAHVAICIQDLLTASCDRCWIESWPVFGRDRLGAGELESAVMRFGRKRDDHVEIGVFEIIEALRPAAAELDADFIHYCVNERVVFSRPYSAGSDEYAMPIEMFHDHLRHRRADGIEATGKEHCGG